MPDDLECRPEEACGVFGVYAPGEDVARLTFFGLFALQHRGQESAGIAVGDGSVVRVRRDMGLVSHVFDEGTLGSLHGDLAVGHTRYSTTGTSSLRNAQPTLVKVSTGTMAVAHNGNLVNTRELAATLRAEGTELDSTSDTELIARLIARQAAEGLDLDAAVIEAMRALRGAYAVAMITPEQLLAFRDPSGIRPLCLGTLNSGHVVVASETAALNVVGARLDRELEPGEVVMVDERGLRSRTFEGDLRRTMCVFEFIYFARPDSQIYGKTLHLVRRRMGHELAKEYPVEADIVIPVPDTGWPAAIGYAEESGIPFGEGLIKNRYIHRTFIQPHQRLRDLGVRMKLTPLRDTVQGKRVVVVEDSIVRGTTSGKIIEMLREAGAREVHMRISSPPYRHPCFYGIDTPEPSRLLASKYSVEEIRAIVGADSLGYLSIEGLVRAIGVDRDEFCMACFTGEYPVAIPDEARPGKHALERSDAAR